MQQNWRLSTELWKLESMIAVMDNLLVYEEKGVAEKWSYTVGRGSIECHYNPNIPEVSTTTTTTSTTTPAPSTVAPPTYKEIENAISEIEKEEDIENIENIGDYSDIYGDEADWYDGSKADW